MKPVVIPPEDAAMIIAAGAELMMQAPTLVKGRVEYMMGALSLALGTAAAMAKVPYQDLIDMISAHYERQLLVEVGEELAAGNETLLDKPEQTQ